MLIIVQRDATQSSLFIILPVHSTSLQRGQTSLATLEGGSCTKKKRSLLEAVFTVLCTPDDGCGWHPKHVDWTCRIINRLLCVASLWTIINVSNFFLYHPWLLQCRLAQGVTYLTCIREMADSNFYRDTDFSEAFVVLFGLSRRMWGWSSKIIYGHLNYNSFSSTEGHPFMPTVLCKCYSWRKVFNPLNAELNPICHLLALLGAHHIFHVSGLRVKYPLVLPFYSHPHNSFRPYFWLNAILYVSWVADSTP